MPAFPIVQLGCTLLDPRQAHTYWVWAARNGLLPAECCQPPNDAGGCWADRPTTPYTDPVTDCASWVDINYAESAEFLGCYVTGVLGLDDPVSTRDSVQNIAGGATPTAALISGRGVRLSGYLVAASCAGMEWGKQWFRRILDDVCRWGGGAQSTCGTGSVSVRVFCPPAGGTETDGIRDIVNVSLGGAPKFSPVDDMAEELVCTCTRMDFEVVLLAGNPVLYRKPVPVIASSAFAGAFDYTPVATVPGVVDIPTEIACLAVPVPPAPDEALPLYDSAGRPSCGAGSAFYGSTAEADFEDERGHPAAGPGSGFYGRVPGETPVWDWEGRPSCGPNSGNYSLWPDPGPVSTEAVITSPIAQWSTPQTFVVTNITYEQIRTRFAFTGTAGAQLRDFSMSLYAKSDFRSPERTLIEQRFVFGPEVFPVATKPSITTVPLAAAYGYLFDVECTFEVLLPAPGDTITVSWVNGSGVGVTAGPNAGTDRDCAAAIAGPNAGVDRAQRTECVSRVASPPTSWVVGRPGVGTLDQDHLGHGASMLVGFLEDEGDRFFGTISPTGVAYCYVEGFDVSGICAGSTILWARLRARFRTPTGPSNALHPWSLSAQNLSGVPIGGRLQSLEVVDGTTDVLFPINTTSASVLSDLAVIVNLAAPPGGTEGWLDYLALEVEYVGGPECVDCGTNAGTDVPCAGASTVGCYTAPDTVALVSGRFVPPTVAAGVPVITIMAGASELRNVAVLAWPDPVARDAPSVSQSAFDFFRALTADTAGEIAWMPALSTLTIDGRSRTVTLAANGITVEASRYLTGPDGGPWQWQTWSTPTRVAVVAPSTVHASAAVAVAAAIGEGI